jgi:predicted transcriptional regulator of viral defense system
MPARHPFKNAELRFSRAGGILRTRDAIRLGVHPKTLYRLEELGRIEPVGRGVWRLTSFPVSEHIDLITVSLRYPRSVVCLVSALAWHDLTTQIPREVQIALPPNTKRPRADFPPVRVFRFSRGTFVVGIETRRIGSARIRVYGAAKTVADCFKFRNRIGLDIALEGLREGWRKKTFTIDELWRYARICRVERAIRPYIESLV